MMNGSWGEKLLKAFGWVWATVFGLSVCLFLWHSPVPVLGTGPSYPQGLRLIDYHSGSDEFMSTCEGHVENQSTETITDARIGFTISDRQGGIVGLATDRIIYPLAPGQQWSFKAVCFRSAPGGTSRLAYLEGR